jgi:hypothetical protein
MATVAGNGAILASPNDVSSMRRAVVDVLEERLDLAAIVAAGYRNIHRYDARSIALCYADAYTLACR